MKSDKTRVTMSSPFLGVCLHWFPPFALVKPGQWCPEQRKPIGSSGRPRIGLPRQSSRRRITPLDSRGGKCVRAAQRAQMKPAPRRAVPPTLATTAHYGCPARSRSKEAGRPPQNRRGAPRAETSTIPSRRAVCPRLGASGRSRQPRPWHRETSDGELCSCNDLRAPSQTD